MAGERGGTARRVGGRARHLRLVVAKSGFSIALVRTLHSVDIAC